MAIVLGLLPAGGAGASSPTLTRVRLVLTTTSEWASLRFDQSYIRAYRFVNVTPGAQVNRNHNLVFISGPSPSSTTVDLVLTVAPSATPSLVLAKSKYGEARAQVVRTNTNPVTVADITNRRTTGDCTVTVPISRSNLVGEGLTIPMLDPRRLTLAFYYPWFEEGEFSRGQWYDRPSGAYRTEDPASVRAMVNQAASAGIDGFIYSWDARYDRPQRFDYVLDAAEQRSGFWAAPVLELLVWRRADGSFDLNGIVNAASLALDRSVRPGYLRMADGRPVLFAYAVHQLGAARWRAVVDAVRARGYSFFAVGDATQPEFALEGSYLYNPNRLTQTQLVNRYTGAASLLRLPAQVDPSVRQRLWAATVSPGQNKSYVNPLDPQIEPRDNGARYDVTWQAALVSQPEWILVTSWNEWYEATHVAPSTRFGTRALEQTKSWSAYFANRVASAPPPSPSEGRRLIQLDVPVVSRQR